jgi:hypothetical protein
MLAVPTRHHAEGGLPKLQRQAHGRHPEAVDGGQPLELELQPEIRSCPCAADRIRARPRPQLHPERVRPGLAEDQQELPGAYPTKSYRYWFTNNFYLRIFIT